LILNGEMAEWLKALAWKACPGILSSDAPPSPGHARLNPSSHRQADDQTIYSGLLNRCT
jgi:hypothetical protein